MNRTSKNKGEIRIPAGINVWKHELSTANALARAGYIVEFLPTKDIKDTKSPDILMDGEKWELKTPKTDKLPAIERNLKRAAKQSGNIVIDSRRLRKIHDSTVQEFLARKFSQQKTIKQLLFVDRKHQVIDISALI
jgi:contact-dependent growth inhibition (CDI) system CdiA-like toxin